MNTVLLQKLKILKAVQKFPAFYGPRRFITKFTTGHHFFVSLAISIQPTLTGIQFIMIRFNIILPSTLRPLKWFLS